MEEIKRIVEGRSLYELSEVEQELASGSQGTNKQNNFNKVAGFIENPDISKVEKLRLLILFALRYENDSLVYQLKQKMRTVGIDDEKLRLADHVLEYAGKQKRAAELFKQQTLGAAAKRLFQMNEVENLLLAHKPVLCNTVNLAMTGKLPTQKFPATQAFNFQDRPENLIIFIVGGATFQEAKEMSTTYNTEADKVIVGGTYMHNSRSFLAEMSTLSQTKNSGIASLEIQ